MHFFTEREFFNVEKEKEVCLFGFIIEEICHLNFHVPVHIFEKKLSSLNYVTNILSSYFENFTMDNGFFPFCTETSHVIVRRFFMFQLLCSYCCVTLSF